MAAILAKILEGKITLRDLEDTSQIDRKQDVSREKQRLKQPNLAELAPFLLNYLREKTSHHLTPRQNAALTPKKTPVSQTKGIKSANEQSQHGSKNPSRGNLFPSQKTPSPSPVTPLSQTRRDKLQEQYSSPSSSPRLRRKSPKVQANERDRLSPLVTQPKININDPEDFPPMGFNSKKATPSRRITPTQVKSDGKKGKSSPVFTSSPFVSGQPAIESHGSPASLQEERNMLKLMRSKKKNKGDSPWGNRNTPSPQTGIKSPPFHVLGDFIITPPKQATTSNAWQPNHSTTNESLFSTPSPYKDINGNSSPDILVTSDLSQQHFKKQTCQEKPVFVQVDKDKVNSQDKLDALAQIYSKCITSNLVPNVTAEVYFVVQLLTTRGIAPNSKQNEKQTEKDKMEDQDVLYSIHNCAYWAVAVLQDIQRLILLLDKDTLRLLADNPRIADFSPGLKETFLHQYKSYSAIKVSELNCIKSPLGGVPFSVERDNKQNFPTDRAFHNFRKQRDVFYELVREWEDCNSSTGWNIEDNQGDRIRALVNQKPELANYSHFARLFKSQLLQMCEEERNGSNSRSSSTLSNLQKSNPEKFQRLQERFVTPSTSLGPCPSPSFTNVQEFFKGFILSAASHSFNQHLIDLLIVTITEMNDKEFPLSDLEEGSEKELSIQNQELKQEFSSCLMKIRILAKFLGFLLFKPYCGIETTSQVVVSETLKLRNRIPVHFDVLGHLKKAWCRGRLVLTIPWAVEYLSMMDPLAPLLDYFSEALHWLSRIYRELAVFPKPDLNHSKLLLTSCLGWLFEISAIPASFFFKSLAERKTSADCEPQMKHSDLKVNLDSSGLVDQGILYSCCPYLGEIRSVLVEAAAGMSGRAGPVKKITPVSADETARISSSQKQLQLQLEENFFRIQPDFLKRMSDFTVERLCSNIISHIKGSIIPSLLDKGVQRIQQFLENEFSSNINNDQAKEKSRPQVLKIIHAVTDDGVKTAVETIESSKKKSLSAFESLCPQDMNHKVIMTAANITTRLVKEKTTDWINTSFPNVMEEELFAQFNKIANSILSSKSKERQNTVESSTRSEEIPGKQCEVNAKCHVPGGISGQNINPVIKIKALQAALSEQSKLLAQQSTNEETHQVTEAVCAVESLLFDETQSYEKEMTMIGQITVELVFIIVCRAAHGLNFVSTNGTKKDCGILDKLTKLWTQLRDKQVPVPFARLLSVPHINLIMTIENRQVIWASVEALFFFLIQKQLVYIYEVEQWYIDALGSARDEETAVEIGKACCSLVLAFHETLRQMAGRKETAIPAQFPLLLSILNQKFSNNASLSTILADCIKNVPGVIAMPQ